YEVHGPSGGKAPTILLSHGYSSTSRMWNGQVAALKDRYQVVVWDSRGHGESDYPKDAGLYSEALTVGDMLALLDLVSARKAIVAGLSLGGYMSLAFHASHPDRVGALMLFGANDINFLAATDYMAGKIKGATKAVIPDAGHAANLHQPVRFNQAVEAFLAKLPAA